MERKKWTPQTVITEHLLKDREKRKWQLSYRRYVIEKKPSLAYAQYFGLDIEHLRQWFEKQFTDDINWENYAEAWQFDHLVPAAYFDFENKEDMALCWNFINMRIDIINQEKKSNTRPDLPSLLNYFTNLYQKTNLSTANKMVEKINSVPISPFELNNHLAQFIIVNKDYLTKIDILDHDEFNKLNQGMAIDEILIERELFRKFG